MDNEPNAILEYYLSHQFALGIAAFEQLKVTTAENVLWVGQCYFGLDYNIEALHYFYRAHALGVADAQIFAASVLRFTGTSGMASDVLHQVDRNQLSGFGLAAWHREYGLQLVAARRLDLAVSELERAWQLANSDELGLRFLPRFSQSLALALLEIGRDASALQYLNQAIGINPSQNPELLLLRAAARAYTGDLLRAEADLDLFNDLVASQFQTRANLIHGFLARSQGLLEKAVALYLETALKAKELGEWETEFYAQLALTALLAEQGHLFVAQAHLARAMGVIPKPSQNYAVFDAMVAIRQAALMTRSGKGDAVSVLQSAIFIFQQNGLERDLGLAYLHLAEASLCSNQQKDGFLALAKAVHVRHSLGSQAYFVLEIRGLPHVFEVICVSRQIGTEILRQDWLALEAQSPQEVQLTTLGTYAIQINGKNLKIEGGTVKAIEFLAYLLESGESRIETIIHDLFSSGSQVMARNRIHKLRESIAKHIPGLTIPHLKEHNTYQIEIVGVRLRWDVREIRQALEQGGTIGINRALSLFTGVFLPKTDLDWAERKRYELEFDVARVGVETLVELFQLEHFEECLRLAQRLAQVALLNIGVQMMLVKATARVHGAIAARDCLAQVDELIQQDLRAIPELQIELRGNEHEFLN